MNQTITSENPTFGSANPKLDIRWKSDKMLLRVALMFPVVTWVLCGFSLLGSHGGSDVIGLIAGMAMIVSGVLGGMASTALCLLVIAKSIFAAGKGGTVRDLLPAVHACVVIFFCMITCYGLTILVFVGWPMS